MKRFLTITILMLMTAFAAKAQKFSVSTNALEWIKFGTINADCGLSVARHLSVNAGATVNPWDFSPKDSYRYAKELSGYVGMRYWPWYVFSGLWVQGKIQFEDYKNTGIWRPALATGKALGAGLAVGYTLMIHEKVNIEFGLGGWGGKLLDYTLYCCPKDMEVRATGPKTFADIDEVSVAFMYIF